MTAEELRALRIRLRLTQREIAERLGVGRPAYGHWEAGRNPIPEGVQSAAKSLVARLDEDEAAIRVRATPAQLRILLEILRDATQSPDLRETAYQELSRVLGLD